MSAAPTTIPVFPLAGAILLPRLLLPLHIFEPRYRAMVRDALEGDRRIGMIQPRDETPVPALYDIGCIGRIVEAEPLEDGRYNIVLEGEARFRMLREHDAMTPYRQLEVEIDPFDDPAEEEALAAVVRADFEREAQRFAKARHILVDWAAVSEMDDETLVNAAVQIGPFDTASKQALLEARSLAERTELMVQLMRFLAQQGEGGADARLQ